MKKTKKIALLGFVMVASSALVLDYYYQGPLCIWLNLNQTTSSTQPTKASKPIVEKRSVDDDHSDEDGQDPDYLLNEEEGSNEQQPNGITKFLKKLANRHEGYGINNYSFPKTSLQTENHEKTKTEKESDNEEEPENEGKKKKSNSLGATTTKSEEIVSPQAPNTPIDISSRFTWLTKLRSEPTADVTIAKQNSILKHQTILARPSKKNVSPSSQEVSPNLIKNTNVANQQSDIDEHLINKFYALKREYQSLNKATMSPADLKLQTPQLNTKPEVLTRQQIPNPESDEEPSPSKLPVNATEDRDKDVKPNNQEAPSDKPTALVNAFETDLSPSIPLPFPSATRANQTQQLQNRLNKLRVAYHLLLESKRWPAHQKTKKTTLNTNLADQQTKKFPVGDSSSNSIVGEPHQIMEAEMKSTKAVTQAKLSVKPTVNLDKPASIENEHLVQSPPKATKQSWRIVLSDLHTIVLNHQLQIRDAKRHGKKPKTFMHLAEEIWGYASKTFKQQLNLALDNTSVSPATWLYDMAASITDLNIATIITLSNRDIVNATTPSVVEELTGLFTATSRYLFQEGEKKLSNAHVKFTQDACETYNATLDPFFINNVHQDLPIKNKETYEDTLVHLQEQFRECSQSLLVYKQQAYSWTNSYLSKINNVLASETLNLSKPFLEAFFAALSFAGTTDT